MPEPNHHERIKPEPKPVVNHEIHHEAKKEPAEHLKVKKGPGKLLDDNNIELLIEMCGSKHELLDVLNRINHTLLDTNTVKYETKVKPKVRK